MNEIICMANSGMRNTPQCEVCSSGPFSKAEKHAPSELNNLLAKNDKLEVGDVWYAKRPGAMCLIVVKITDITAKTIEVKEDAVCARNERYKRGYLEFIARKEADLPKAG